MDLSSRWDRCAGVFFILLAIAAMAGCLALSASGNAPKSGSVVASSTKLDFGADVVGASKQLTDTLTNSSSATVAIASAMSSDPSFQVTAPSMPFNLAPGQSAPLTIAFTPHVAGKPVGQLSISTSAAAAGTITVAVTGSAVAAGALEVSPASLSFGTVAVGQSEAKTATLKNSGETSVTVSNASASSAAFTINGLTLPTTLAAGQSTSLTVTFAPKASGTASGSVAVNGSASLTTSAASGSSASPSAATSTSLSVAGDATSAGQLAVSPVSVAFGSVTVGTTQTQNVTITNSGGTSATISQASATGSGVGISGLSWPLTLAPNQSSTFQVSFAPTAAGAVSGGIAIVSSASNANLALAVTGTAVPPGSLVVAPSSLGFGSVQVGTSQSQPGTLTNSGGSNVTITKATAAGAGFSVSGLAFPMTLSPGQSSPFSVTFAPQTTGSVSGSVAFTSNVATTNLPLSGVGLAQGTLGPNPASVSFGSVQVGSNQVQTVTLTNGGAASVTITQSTPSGTGFSLSGLSLPTTLASGQSTSLTTTFTPAGAGSVTGSIAITSTATNPSLNIPLSGTGVTAATLAANPTSIAFGSVQVGSTQSHSQALSNTGGSVLHISTATVTGAGFATSGLNVPTTLNPGQNLTFNVTFTPQSSASVSGSLALSSDGTVTNLSIALTGSGTSPGQLAVAPATVNFGNVIVGARQNQTGTLTASGAGVTVSSVTSSNGEFTLSGLSLPITLNAGQNANFTLTFAPQASGAASGTITFASNATNTPVAESVAGTGTAAPQHSVSLSWNASTSTVVGYKVYRGTQSGGPYAAVTSAPDASTAYTDSNVVAGSTYYYVVTAVDSSGNESVYSNQAQAVIPTP